MRNPLSLIPALWLSLSGCGPVRNQGSNPNGTGSPPDLALSATDGNPQNGNCGELQGCYTVYAHSDHVLYHIDLVKKMLVQVGPFKAPMVPGGNGMMAEDVITDLAVAPDDTIWVISHTNLYTADPGDGHVTLVGPVTACGKDNVALTFTPDGQLYAADFKGAFCKIDISTKPPQVKQVGTLSNGLGIAGDIVAVKDGTMFGTAYTVANSSSDNNDTLVILDPATGAVKQTIGLTGYPKLFGVAFAMDQVFGFTHDGSGDVVTIDPKTGKGMLFNKFMDPNNPKNGISFAGAGVNAMVEAPPPG